MTQPDLRKGDRIEIVELVQDDPCPIEIGTTGTVQSIHELPLDMTWQVYVAWDAQRSLSLVLPKDADIYRKIP